MTRLLGLALLALSALVAPTSAQQFPSKPVHIVVPYPPGGPPDVVGRLYAGKLQDMWGQPVVIENRSGANGNIGAQTVAKAANDGSTLLLHASSLVINPHLYTSPGYDASKDFTPLGIVFDYKLVVVVHPSLPARTFKELIDLVRSKPGSISYASAGGFGAPTHLSVEMFKQMASVDLLHVPYPGAAQAANDLLAGHVSLMFNNPVLSLPHIRSGALRALATTGARRMPQLPDLPTVAEQGYPSFDVGTWFALWAPAGTPAAVVDTINAAIAKVTALPDVRERLESQGFNPIASSPAEHMSFQRAESERWGKVIKSAGIKLE